MEACRVFYEMLGLRFAKHRHGAGPEHFAHEGEVIVELYPAKSDDRDRTGVGFSVENLEHTRREMIMVGLGASEIHANPWGRSFVVRDPDRRRVEITEHREVH